MLFCFDAKCCAFFCYDTTLAAVKSWFCVLVLAEAVQQIDNLILSTDTRIKYYVSRNLPFLCDISFSLQKKGSRQIDHKIFCIFV